MLVFTTIANWWEQQRRNSNAVLDKWVEDSSYNNGVMIAAATTKSLMTFGAGFVDVLRLGDGAGEGTLRGVGEDALRLAAIFPVGTAARMLKSAKGLQAAKVIVDTGGPNCFWVASAKAFAQVSQAVNGKLYAGVPDIASALKMNMQALWQIPSLAHGLTHLRTLGARVGQVRAIRTIKEMESMVPFDGSVLMLAVRVVQPRGIAGHAVYAYRDMYMRIRYMDRTIGEAGVATYRSLDELRPLYGAKAIEVMEAAVLHNVFAKTIAHDATRLVMPILGVIASERDVKR